MKPQDIEKTEIPASPVERLVMPLQPLSHDEHGVLRFKANKIVEYLLDNGGIDMNQLALQGFDDSDSEQFAQLIGYSLSGFGSLSYVSEEASIAAEKMASGKTELEARNEHLRDTLDSVRKGVKAIAPYLFKIHPDDLEA